MSTSSVTRFPQTNPPTVPRGGDERFVAPTLQPASGTHDAVKFPTGEIFHIPSALSDESKNKIAQIIHSHLVNPTLAK